jgi:arylsulfatase A-like enzyme
VAVPGQQKRGVTCDALVEFVDIYPSLADLCELPAPQGTEGRSFKPLIGDPEGDTKSASHSWYPKGGYQGIAMRTDRWRFVEWRKAGQPSVYELYDHRSDPQENQNLAGRPEYAQTIKELAAKLHEKFPAGR